MPLLALLASATSSPSDIVLSGPPGDAVVAEATSGGDGIDTAVLRLDLPGYRVQATPAPRLSGELGETCSLSVFAGPDGVELVQAACSDATSGIVLPQVRDWGWEMSVHPRTQSEVAVVSFAFSDSGDLDKSFIWASDERIALDAPADWTVLTVRDGLSCPHEVRSSGGRVGRAAVACTVTMAVDLYGSAAPRGVSGCGEEYHARAIEEAVGRPRCVRVVGGQPGHDERDVVVMLQ